LSFERTLGLHGQVLIQVSLIRRGPYWPVQL
jgi:hypothetical protein